MAFVEADGQTDEFVADKDKVIQSQTLGKYSLTRIVHIQLRAIDQSKEPNAVKRLLLASNVTFNYLEASLRSRLFAQDHENTLARIDNLIEQSKKSYQEIFKDNKTRNKLFKLANYHDQLPELYYMMGRPDSMMPDNAQKLLRDFCAGRDIPLGADAPEVDVIERDKIDLAVEANENAPQKKFTILPSDPDVDPKLIQALYEHGYSITQRRGNIKALEAIEEEFGIDAAKFFPQKKFSNIKTRKDSIELVVNLLKKTNLDANHNAVKLYNALIYTPSVGSLNNSEEVEKTTAAYKKIFSDGKNTPLIQQAFKRLQEYGLMEMFEHFLECEGDHKTALPVEIVKAKLSRWKEIEARRIEREAADKAKEEFEAKAGDESEASPLAVAAPKSSDTPPEGAKIVDADTVEQEPSNDVAPHNDRTELTLKFVGANADASSEGYDAARLNLKIKKDLVLDSDEPLPEVTEPLVNMRPYGDDLSNLIPSETRKRLQLPQDGPVYQPLIPRVPVNDLLPRGQGEGEVADLVELFGDNSGPKLPADIVLEPRDEWIGNRILSDATLPDTLIDVETIREFYNPVSAGDVTGRYRSVFHVGFTDGTFAQIAVSKRVKEGTFISRHAPIVDVETGEAVFDIQDLLDEPLVQRLKCVGQESFVNRVMEVCYRDLSKIEPTIKRPIRWEGNRDRYNQVMDSVMSFMVDEFRVPNFADGIVRHGTEGKDPNSGIFRSMVDRSEYKNIDWAIKNKKIIGLEHLDGLHQIAEEAFKLMPELEEHLENGPSKEDTLVDAQDEPKVVSPDSVLSGEMNAATGTKEPANDDFVTIDGETYSRSALGFNPDWLN